MADRYTRKDAEAALDRLLAAMGERRAQDWNDVGGYRLDYNPIYGGVVVERVVNDSGAVTCPLGYQRRSPREFVEVVQFALEALQVVTRKRAEAC